MNIGNIGPGLLVSLHKQPMKWHVALGELCDNSFDAGASRVELRFGPSKQLQVIDDGNGCPSVERMLTLGDHYHQSTTRLGRYGVGLKEAACWLWGELLIETIHRGNKSKARIDWGALSKQDDWNVPDPVCTECDLPSSTQLTFRNISKGFPDYTHLQAELSYTFAPALWAGKQIAMKFARRKAITCAGWQMPSVEEHVDDTFSVDGKGVSLKAGIVSMDVQNTRKGFSICHGHRMIGDSTAFGSMGLSVSRICGIVRLDSSWSLSKNKTEVVDESQEALERAIFERCEGILRKSTTQAEILRNTALESAVSEGLQSILGEMRKARRAPRSSGNGTVAAVGSKKKHKQAKNEQPGSTFLAKCRVGQMRMEWESRSDNQIGHVDLHGSVIYLNENHNRLRHHRENENTDALIDHCMTLLSFEAIESPQRGTFKKFRDYEGFIDALSHVLDAQQTTLEAAAAQ